MEGNVYTCCWKRVQKHYKLWLKLHPALLVEASSFHSAEEKMNELICLKLGDGESVMEFAPPPPVDAFLQGFDSPAIVSIAGNDTVDVPRQTPGLFAKGYCPLCTRAWGERTDMELNVDVLPRTSDGAVCLSVPFIGKIFSEDFMSLLSEHERSQFRVLRVYSSEQSERQFVELIGRPVARFVGLSGLPGFDAHPCSECGYRAESHFFKNAVYHFLALEDLPVNLPTIFAVGARGTTVCMTASRWKELAGKQGTKNLVAKQVHVIPKRKSITD